MCEPGIAVRVLVLLASTAGAIGCGSGPAQVGSAGGSVSMTPELAADLAVARRARILFGHHSVGDDILAGIARIDAQAANGRLHVAPLEKLASIDGPVLAEGRVGRNGDPRSKVDQFAAAIRSQAHRKPDLAFMKFCYVDFNPQTNVEEVFSYYLRTMESLKREHPEVRFAHVTVPLMRQPMDVKSRFLRLLGRESWEDSANRKRSEFSMRLKEAFPADPILDIARLESTEPDGKTVTFRQGGRSYPSLSPRYTVDGGHLNTLGQDAAGAAAVRFIADGLRRPRDAR